MKTLVIYSNFQDLPKFAIIDGDCSHLHDKCVNSIDVSSEEEAEIVTLTTASDGRLKDVFSGNFPLSQHFDKVANIGFFF